jgi:hypothetical protein
MIQKSFLRPLSAILLAALTLIPNISKAQTPVARPYTMTTVAGGLAPASSYGSGKTCPGNSTTMTTASGDNCPAVSAAFGAAGRGGVAVDSYGNVFVADDITKAIHMIDPTTGVMTLVAGLGTVCGSSAGKLSSAGDGCLAATQTTLGGPRGIGLDAYGNVLIPEYSQNVIHIVCRNASPLCAAGTPAPTAANPIQVQIGYMGLVGGCVSASGSTGTSGTGTDGTPGFSTFNSASTNTASYPVNLSGSASAFKVTAACTAANGEVAAPRAAWGDIYGNVYYADTTTSRTRVILGPYTSSYFSGVNPLYAALAVNTNWTWTGTISTSTLKPGYVYTVVNVSGVSGSYNTTALVTAGSSCLKTLTANSVTYANSSITSTALDTHADGCPFFDSAISASSGYTDTAATDAAGNLVFTDPGTAGLLRVFFVQGWSSTSAATTAGVSGSVASAGVAMYNAIVKNNPGVTPTAGYIYALAGGVGLGQAGFVSTALSTAPTLGNTTTIASTSINKLAVSPQGNIYIGVSGSPSSVLLYDIYNGTIRTLLTSAGSSVTKGNYCNGSSGAKSQSAYSDGCPASQALWGNGNALGLGVDGQGNLYLYDSSAYTSGMLVRKVLAQGTGTESAGTLKALASSVSTAYPLQALGTAQTQTFQVHFPYATAQSATVSNSTNPNFVYGSPSCTWYPTTSNANYDNSMDCSVVVTYTPSAAGPQSASMTLVASGGESATINLGGTVAGSVLAIDSPSAGGASLMTTASLFAGNTPTSVAVDGAGNVYAVIGSSGSYSIVESLGGSASSQLTIASGLTAQPTSLAVDKTGNIFYLNGSSAIQELAVSTAGSPNTYSAASVSYVPTNLGTANPVALAVDSVGNLFVADNQNGTDYLYRISTTAFNAYGSVACNASATAGTPLCQAVVSGVVSSAYGALRYGVVNALAVDPSGNIYVSDTTNSKLYELTPGIDSTLNLWDYASTAKLSSTTATGLATDAAGDLYVQTSSGVTMYPQSGPTSAGVAVYSGETAPSGIAVDGLGNLYNADTEVNSLTQVQRNTVSEDFQSNYSLVLSAELSNVGNQASSAQSSANGVNAGAFTLGGGSNACAFSSSLLNAMSAGQACSLTAQFPAIGGSEDYDHILFTQTAPATSVIGALNLQGLADQKGWNTTSSIGTASPSSPVYAPSGTEVSFPITVTATALSTDGTTTITAGPTTSNYVLVSVDSGAAVNYPFTGTNGLAASVTLNLSGLTAGSHSFTVTFPQQGSFLPSSASSGSFSIAPITPQIVWSPSTTTQPVSAALGMGVLDATVTPSIAGNFVYSTTGTVTCQSTNAATIDASTYLPIGSYTLYVVFCPTDSTDYASQTASTGYAVQQATTTASVGASTSVVAADGSGNFTTLSAALVALPTTGGTIYIKPGTYTGQNAISYPNVALRGLGGDPTKVILTAEDGAFSTPFTGFLGTGTGSGNANASGDQGSSTLDVTKSYYMGQTSGSTSNPIGLTNTTQYTPNNFYAEYLTIQNTYNIDSSTTTTYDTSSGSCAVDSSLIASPATLQSLYNNGKQCNSQALALWIESDEAVLNNVNLYSQQDTLYAGSQGCGTYCTAARQYMWKGLISGDVDYVFGDAALVFDHTNFFTTWHGTSATGTETIEAQNKKYETGSASDYLSGYVCNGCTLMSESTGMTALYYGRPYGTYSTWISLNSYVDQVAPVGWIEFSGDTNLPTSTYGEYNSMAYTDPAVGTSPYPASINNITPTGSNTGSGVTSISSREKTSTNPGTIEASNSTPTQLTAAQAVQYYPVNFLSNAVSAATRSAGSAATWNPVAALAAQVNNFVPVASVGAIPLGGSVTILGRPQTPGAGVIPTGTYAFYDSLNNNQSCTAAGGSCTQLATGSLDASGEAYLTTNSLASGMHYITMVYGGDSNFSGSTSSIPYSIYVLNTGQQAVLTTLNVANTSSTTGTPLTGTVTLGIAPSTSAAAINDTASIYLDGVAATTCAIVNGTCTWSIPGPANGAHTMYAYYAGSTAYGHSTSSTVSLYVSAPVATGDTRTVTEPSFPAVCTQLTAALTTDPVIQDLDASVDATVTNIDGARIQAALNSCSATAVASNTQLAVELSMDSTATYNAFLSGPLSMPSNVTLLVDPNVTLYFSRNVQDYDTVAGTHTCGTINGNSATSSCLNLIDIPKTSTNVGIMGYGKLNGRGGDPLFNTFTTSGYAMPSSPTWWAISGQANGEGSQQNPRFIQMESGTSNITLYKISILNAPMFHVTTGGAVSNLTVWDIKIVTPTSSRNTDGIDPGAVQNLTIANSWISDGDDNVAVAGHGGVGRNMSIINNHFFAGHGESIGSLTDSGVNNILFDHNMLAGNNVAGYGSAQWGLATDGNSTGIRIKSYAGSGGNVTNVQYSNSCILDHYIDIQFTPYYSSSDGTKNPNFNSILMQNLVFLNDAGKSGTVEMDGFYSSNGDINGGSAVINPLGLTMDNVTFPSGLSSLVASTAPSESSAVWNYGGYSGGTGQYVNLTVGPGQVSSNFLTLYNALVANSANNDTLTNNISLSSLDAPSCVFTYLAPELTGPNGVAQTVPYGNTAMLDVILTPAVGGAPYPTGTVTLTDTTTSNTYTGTLSGTGDTLVATIPAADMTLGAHTFTATYLGDSNYTVPASYQTFGNYQITVVQATPTIAWTPAATSITYGTTLNGLLNATASVPGNFTYTATPTAGGSANAVTSSSVLQAGSYTITANFAPTDNVDYTNASSTLNLTVGQATPVLGWTKPAAITYGTTLANVLNPAATFNSAAVAGGFTYTAAPAAGGSAVTVTGTTVLTAGSWTLTATFTPTDSTDYVSAGTTSTTLTVNQAAQTINFAAIASPVKYTSAIQLSATGGASGNAVTFSVVSGPATILGNTLIITAPGAVVVEADQAGNSNYLAAAAVRQTVVSLAQNLTANVSSLGFGTVLKGSSGTAQTVILANPNGFATSTVSIAVTGDFTQTNACGTIGALSTCSVVVNYTPTTSGTETGTLTITDTTTGSSISVALSGTGSTAGVQIAPAVANFGSVVLGSSSYGQAIAIANTGTADLAISNVATTGDYATSGSCTTVKAGSTCTLTTTFTPTAAGTRSGTITLTDNAGGSTSTQTVMLTGIGTLAGATVSPGVQNFPATVMGKSSGALTVTLSNTGTASLTSIGISIAGDFSETTTCSATLAASSSCTIAVTYSPTVAGSESGTLTITDNLGAQTVALNGTGLAASVNLGATQLSFGSQLTGTTSSAQTVVLTNNGTASMTVSSVTASNGFSDTTNCPGALAAGSSCSINVSFAPTTTGSQSGSITIADSVGTQTVAVQGLGASVGLSLTPSYVNFGAQQVGTTSQAQTLVLKNTGTTTLTLASITATSGYAASSQCSTTLAPGASCLISLSFTPTATGTVAGSVTVTDSTGNVTTMAMLTGQGTLPGITASPALLSFGSVTVNSTSSAQVITVTNNGTAALTISSVAATGDFAETNNCAGNSIAAGSSCVISVTMTPTTSGTRTGSIQIVDNADGLHSVALNGIGQQAGVSVSPISLAFGSLPFVSSAQVANATGTTLGVTITNTGNAKLTLSSLTTLGDFTESDNCGGSVAAGASCTAEVKFVPTATGHRTGTLMITDNAGGGTQVVSLQGDGSPAGLTLTPAVLSFGAVSTGSTATSRTVQLSNNTGQTITALAITASGEVNESNNCSSTMATGTSCTLTISVTPELSGAVTGTVTITGGGLSIVSSSRSSAFHSEAAGNSTTSSVGVVALTANAESGTVSASKLVFTTTPTSAVTAGGNAGSAITVLEEDNNGNVANASDTIVLTVTGPSGYSKNYTTSASGGVATFNLSSAALTAAGSYTYTASVNGSSSISSATASETVSNAAAAKVLVTSGSGQSAAIGSAFGSPLLVTVTDAYGNTVSGVTVAFTVPSSGASATLSATSATTGSAGTASVTATAGTTASSSSYTVTAAVSGATSGSFALTNTKTAPTVTVATNAATVVQANAVTFTANVTSSVTAPTGSVEFLDGSTVLATVPLTAGPITYTTSSLALGSHTISVDYLGDSNFQTTNSTSVAVSVITISIGTIGSGSGGTGSGSGNDQVVQPGGTASYALPITPNTGTSFPIPLTMSVSGLPTGALATVTPSAWVQQSNGTSWVLAAGTALTSTTQLNIVVPGPTASNQPAGHPFLSHAAPFAFALLLLPFAGRIRRSGKRMARMLSVLLILAAGAAATAGVTGCGGSGFFASAAKTYTINVSITAGSLSQATTLNLTVE